MSRKFESLYLEGWQQFDNVDLELHSRLTVLCGANGAGKSSLLRIFAGHFGYARPYLSTPHINRDGGLTYTPSLFQSAWGEHKRRADMNVIGFLQYDDKKLSDLRVPGGNAVQYSIEIPSNAAVEGLHFDSHQPAWRYDVVNQIPTALTSPAAALSQYDEEMRQFFHRRGASHSPAYRLKEALIAMALFGEGNSKVQANIEIRDTYNGFIETLRDVLPPEIGFQRLDVRPPEVVLVTKSGDFLIDASSGGLTKLIDIAWRLFLFSRGRDGFVATFDEPENHLHPSLQRALMPRLVSTFPKVQFIIATHSPFMVSSVRDSRVYVLRYRTEAEQKSDSKRRVECVSLDTADKAGSANDILRQVLGVPSTMPVWAENAVEDIASDFNISELTEGTIAALRQRLQNVGLGDYYSEALARMRAKHD